jgi:hypothetical protein
MEEQFYYNKCACNEYDALIRRQALDDIPGYTPGNQHIRALRQNLLNLASRLKPTSNFYQASHAEVMEHTRSTIRKRYEFAHFNIKNKRIRIENEHAGLKAFVKFEKIPVGKREAGKPARLIQFRSYEYLYSLKSFILTHSLTLKRTELLVHFDQPLRTVFTKLYDNPGIAAVLKSSWDSFVNPVAICCDHSKFDGHYCSELLDIEHEYWDKLFNSSYLRFLLNMQHANKGYTQNGLKYKMTGHRASGEYTTSEGNSLVNYMMIATYLDSLGVTRARIHVNGDDSVIIVEHEDVAKVSTNLEFFTNFNMQTENDRIAYTFPQITYCQTSPIRLYRLGQEEWYMVKDPYRTMARMCYCETKYAKGWERYVDGIALCELACDMGVPMLQEWCRYLLARSGLAKPLGSVDKYPARLSGTQKLGFCEVHATTREDFCDAFGVDPESQRSFESKLAGLLKIDNPSILAHIKQYQNFHQN